jgi:hypothetical protein
LLNLYVGDWTSSEIILNEPSFGYGTYHVKFTSVGFAFADIDPNLVFGVFLYDDYTPGVPAYNNEVDLEISKWAAVDNPNTLQFVRQPFESLGNFKKFALPAAQTEMSFVLTWLEGSLQFQLFNGHGASACGNLASDQVATWTYTCVVCTVELRCLSPLLN